MLVEERFYNFCAIMHYAVMLNDLSIWL